MVVGVWGLKLDEIFPRRCLGAGVFMEEEVSARAYRGAWRCSRFDWGFAGWFSA